MSIRLLNNYATGAFALALALITHSAICVYLKSKVSSIYGGNPLGEPAPNAGYNGGTRPQRGLFRGYREAIEILVLPL